jgi:hypothetical protein
MAAEGKVPEWKQISDTQKAKAADRSDKLKAARLARDAALPPPPPPTAKKARTKKAKPAPEKGPAEE